MTRSFATSGAWSTTAGNPFAPASDALVAFRRRGGAVVLITNAPRPSRPIREQILHLGVSPDAFDVVVTSGDVTVAMIAERVAQPVCHIGPRRDLSLFEAVEARAGARPELTTADHAAYVLCTGLFHDDVETPEDYEGRLRAIAARGLPFICANPDLIIHRGSTLVYCAGALARRYEELGGKTIYAGKPYPPIYRAALSAAEAALGRPIEPSADAGRRRRHAHRHRGRRGSGARRIVHQRRHSSRRGRGSGSVVRP